MAPQAKPRFTKDSATGDPLNLETGQTMPTMRPGPHMDEYGRPEEPQEDAVAKLFLNALMAAVGGPGGISGRAGGAALAAVAPKAATAPVPAPAPTGPSPAIRSIAEAPTMGQAKIVHGQQPIPFADIPKAVEGVAGQQTAIFPTQVNARASVPVGESISPAFEGTVGGRPGNVGAMTKPARSSSEWVIPQDLSPPPATPAPFDARAMDVLREELIGQGKLPLAQMERAQPPPMPVAPPQQASSLAKMLLAGLGGVAVGGGMMGAQQLGTMPDPAAAPTKPPIRPYAIKDLEAEKVRRKKQTTASKPKR